MTKRLLFWSLFTVTLAVYLVIVLWSLPIIARDAGGLVPFDLRPFGYTREEAVAFLSALGEVGLAQYQGPQQWLDTVYPALMAATLVAAFFGLFRRRSAVALGAVALLAALFDYQENIAVADLLNLGAEGVDGEVVSIASLMTMLKSGFSTVAMMAVLVGLALAAWRRWARQT